MAPLTHRLQPPRLVPLSPERLESRLCFCTLPVPHAEPPSDALLSIAAAGDAVLNTVTAAAPVLDVPPPDAPTAGAIRLDVGRGPHTDLNGRTWSRDTGFVGGTVSSTPFEVANTLEDPLYYTRRWGNFDYKLAVPNGSFDVRLHFADPIYTQPGKRKFNVFAEGRLALGNFDIAARGGGKSALVRSVVVNVTDGSLHLRFQSVYENAIVSAIEVVPRATGGWASVAPAPVGTFESQAAAVNGKIFVFGGFYGDSIRATRAAHAYDPHADTWTRLAEVPRPVTHAATAAEGNVVWLAGGFVGDYPNNPATREVWKYDVALNTWSPGPALPEAIAAGAMVRLGRKMHVFGGLDAFGADSPTHFVYDIDRPHLGWRTLAPLPNARNHLGGVAVGDKMYAVGGQHGLNEATGNVADVHAYDWTTDRWTLVASLPQARSHITASTFVANNRLFVVGGVTNGIGASTVTADVLELNLATKLWTTRDPLPGIRKAPVARFLSGRLIVATGSAGHNAPSAVTWTRGM